MLKHELYKRKTKKHILTYQDPIPSATGLKAASKVSIAENNPVILNKRINSIQIAPGLRTYTDFKKSPSSIGRQNSNSCQNYNGSAHATNRKRGASQFKTSGKEALVAAKLNQRSEVIVLPQVQKTDADQLKWKETEAVEDGLAVMHVSRHHRLLKASENKELVKNGFQQLLTPEANLMGAYAGSVSSTAN